MERPEFDTRYGCRWTSDDTRVQVIDNLRGTVVAEIARVDTMLTNDEAWSLAVSISRQYEAVAAERPDPWA